MLSLFLKLSIQISLISLYFVPVKDAFGISTSTHAKAIHLLGQLEKTNWRLSSPLCTTWRETSSNLSPLDNKSACFIIFTPITSHGTSVICSMSVTTDTVCSPRTQTSCLIDLYSLLLVQPVLPSGHFKKSQQKTKQIFFCPLYQNCKNRFL